MTAPGDKYVRPPTRELAAVARRPARLVALSGRACIGCGSVTATYRVGKKRADRACGDCIVSGRVPPVS